MMFEPLLSSLIIWEMPMEELEKMFKKSISWGRLEAGVNLILIKFYHTLKMQGFER